MNPNLDANDDGDSSDCVILDKQSTVFSPECSENHEAKKTSSGRKLKQTVLCFKRVDANLAVPCVSNPQPSKKKRLSEPASFTKSTKNMQKHCVGDKRKSFGGIVDEDDKEVSSSCEMNDKHPTLDSGVSSNCLRNSTGLRKFLYSGQMVEVTTTSGKDEDLLVDSGQQNEAEAIEEELKDFDNKDTENKENIPENDNYHLEKTTCNANGNIEFCRELESDLKIENASRAGQDISAEDNLEHDQLCEERGSVENETGGDIDLSGNTNQQSVTSYVKEAETFIGVEDVIRGSEVMQVDFGSDCAESIVNMAPDSSTFTDAGKLDEVLKKGNLSPGLCKMKDEHIQEKLTDSSAKFAICNDAQLSETIFVSDGHELVAEIKQKTSGKAKSPLLKKLKVEQKEKGQQLRKKHKEEMEQQKKERKEQRERDRLEAKIQKEKEKFEREKERTEKKKQKDEERQKRLEQQEEEKKKKEEFRLEEKRKKEEEKRKREEEKQEKEKGSQKEKLLMKNFFIKSGKDMNSSFQQMDAVHMGPFMPFELKNNMRLAPPSRCENSTLSNRMAHLDLLMESQSSILLYMDELKKKLVQIGKSGKTWPSGEFSDLLVLGSSTDLMKAKFFQFTENYRPAYYGTWRKCSNFIKGRRPFAKDTHLFDYEIDSDEEWEEEEPGESLSHSEDEEENELDVDQDDEEGDGFFVPHGYLSEGEGCENDEDEQASPEKLKAKQLAKARNWEAEISTKRHCEVLHPLCIGISWSGHGLKTVMSGNDINKLAEYEAVIFEPQPIQIPDISTFSSEEVNKLLRKDLKMDKKKKEKGIKYISVPDIAIPDLIQLVHGNKWSIVKLVREFQEFWRCKTAKSDTSTCQGGLTEATNKDRIAEAFEEVCLISKRKLDSKIREIAVYERHPSVSHKKFWYVNSEQLEKYGLSGLPVPTEWKWVTKLPDESLDSVKKLKDGYRVRDNSNKKSCCKPNVSLLQSATVTSALTEKIHVNELSHCESASKRDDKYVKFEEKPVKKQLIKQKHKRNATVQCIAVEGFHQSPMQSECTAMKSNTTLISKKIAIKPVTDAVCKTLFVTVKKLPDFEKCNLDSSIATTTSKSDNISLASPSLDAPSQKRSSDGCTPDAKRPNLGANCFDGHDEVSSMIVSYENVATSSKSGTINVGDSKPVEGE